MTAARRRRTGSRQVDPDVDGDGAAAAERDPAEEIRRGYDSCIRSLAAAPRTRAQLAALMQRKDIADDAAALILASLERDRLIDDVAYAQAFVASRRGGGSHGPAAIRRTLASRGIDRTIIDEVVGGIDPDEVRRRARELALRRIHVGGGDESARRRRTGAYLARRGYPPSVIADALADARAALSAPVGPDGASAEANLWSA